MGSDTIYVVTSAVHISPDGTNVVRTERHPITAGGSGMYEGVDSHETFVGPVAASWSEQVPKMQEGVSITTVFFEHDHGDPDAFRDEVDAAVKLAIALSTYIYPPAGAVLALIEASGLLTDLFNSLLGTDDDEIGSTTVVLRSEQELENFSRRTPNQSLVKGSEFVDIGLPHHFLAEVSGGDYFAGFVVERSPDLGRKPIIIE